MNWSDEDIDTLFRTGANDIKPVYDPAFWSEMEAMLPVEKKHKVFPWFWTSLSAVVILIGLTSFNWFFLVEKSNDLHGIQLSQSNETLVSRHAKKTPTKIQPTSEIQTIDIKSTAVDNLITTKKSEKRSPKYDKNPLVSQTLNLCQIPTDFEVSSNQNVKEKNAVSTTLLEFLPISWKNKKTRYKEQSLIYLFSERKKPSFYVDFGVGASQSFVKSVDASPQMNISAGAGISYFYSRFGVSMGTQLSVIQLSDLVLNRRSKVYCFTSTDYTQRLQYKQLYTVSIPMNLIYKTTRSRFELGISPSYVVQTKLAYTSSINGELDQIGTALNTDFGLNRFNVLGQMGYHISLSENWSAGVRISTWLTQPTQEGVFESKSTRLPTQSQFTLRYSL
jgi:hypothetical protein